MKKRFIILIDFSEYSANLLRYAFDWSQHVDAELVLLHQTTVIIPALSDKETRSNVTQFSNQQALEKLKNLKDEAISEKEKVRYVVSEISLVRTLTELTAEPLEHLIFVGLKGTGLLKKTIIGSMALEVIEKTNVTVVAMPKEISKFNPEKIYVAVSDKYPFNILAFNNLLGCIGTGIEKITFFYWAQPDEDTSAIEKHLSDLSQLFVSRYTTDYHIYNSENSDTAIKTVINNTIEELLVIQKGNRFLSDQLFRKFLINELVYEGQTPLIILPKESTLD